ncbi:hypothetical protein L6452_17738 [Arctium lappa]|uniref:Uncharacterized protein n=1 Tax=Arctium lappa TaxID=4217 RepID=A0ACB9C4F5_ARCLA|nr:hypothetical protein L6452_17738 [Arctium lappa]
MDGIHPTFHVCYLRKCLAEEESVIPLSEIRVDNGNRCVEEPESILESKVKKLRHKDVVMVKVQWKHHRGANITWESEDDMKKRYPHLALSPGWYRGLVCPAIVPRDSALALSPGALSPKVYRERGGARDCDRDSARGTIAGHYRPRGQPPPFGIEMVNTQSRARGTPEGHVEEESAVDRPPVGVTTDDIPLPRILGGGPEHIPRRDLGIGNAIMEEVTLETRLRDNMMSAMNAALAQQQLAMTSAMTQQQEFFMKLLEDRDASNRQPETMAENVVVGSGGPNVVLIEEPSVEGIRPKTKGCTYKTFLGCHPKEFAGSDSPIACMYWLKEMEMAFEASECDSSQRVKFASQLLRGEALIWWNLTRSALVPEVLAKLTWPVFKEKLMDN